MKDSGKDTNCADVQFARRIAMLSAAPPEIFWRESFSRSAATKAKSWKEVHSLGKRASDCGRLYGKQAARRRESVSELCLASGLSIQELSAPPSPQRELLGLFEPPYTIFVRTAFMDRCDRYLADSGLDRVLGTVCCRDIVLAHEYFHFLETRDYKTIFTRTYTEPCGIFKRRSTLAPLSEIAAMSFAQELLGLSWSPFLLDWIVLSLSDRHSALSVLERWECFAAETSVKLER